MRINEYTCQSCGGKIVTRDLVDGTTPFMIGCCVKPEDFEIEKRNDARTFQAMSSSIELREFELPSCKGLMQSCFYACNQSLTPTFEFYRPEGEELEHLDHITRHDHVDHGGLLLRPIQA